jgi:hypothetical protein
MTSSEEEQEEHEGGEETYRNPRDKGQRGGQVDPNAADFDRGTADRDFVDDNTGGILREQRNPIISLDPAHVKSIASYTHNLCTI